MPELPEVETTRAGIAPHLQGVVIQAVIVRESRLRWPVSEQLAQMATGQKVLAVERRAKYLLIKLANGYLMLHLGMSGSLRILSASTAPQKHASSRANTAQERAPGGSWAGRATSFCETRRRSPRRGHCECA